MEKFLSLLKSVSVFNIDERKRVQTITILGFLAVFVCCVKEVKAENNRFKPFYVFSFGVIPVEPLEKINKNWSPLLKDISKNQDFMLKISLNDSMTEFEDYLKLNIYDFAVVSQYQYDNVLDKDDYILLEKNSKQKKLQEKSIFYIVGRKSISSEYMNLIVRKFEHFKLLKKYKNALAEIK